MKKIIFYVSSAVLIILLLLGLSQLSFIPSGDAQSVGYNFSQILIGLAGIILVAVLIKSAYKRLVSNQSDKSINKGNDQQQ